jgi:multiple antibiotic resistance protein
MVLIRLVGCVLVTLLAFGAIADDDTEVLTLGVGKVFTFFFLTLGPKAVIAPFARATAILNDGARRKVAFAAAGISILSVVIAATIGVRVLENWGISAGSLLVAAGVILFLVALDSIRSQYEPEGGDASLPSSESSVRRLAFQIAFPHIVSPYGVAVVILVLTIRPETVGLSVVLGMLAGIMLLNLLAMLAAQRIAGSVYLAPLMAVVGAVLAVLQAALGVQAVLTGLRMAGAA